MSNPPASPAGVTARAWCRIDLAGGTLDIWPLGQLVPEARTLSVAVSLPVSVTAQLTGDLAAPTAEATGTRAAYSVHMADAGTVQATNWTQLKADPKTALIGVIAEALDLPPVQLHLNSASPRGAGLGASSALAVAVIAACQTLLDPARAAPETAPGTATRTAVETATAPDAMHRYAAMARDLEARLMRLPTGTQDHYAALLGGVVELTYPAGGINASGTSAIQRLDVDLDALGDSLVVAYSGQSHISADTNWQVIRRFLDGEADTVACFDGIAAAAGDLRSALLAGDLEAVGTCMAREWGHRCRLAPGVSTPKLEALLQAARDHGAWGGKACGAGGGGCLAVLSPPERRDEVARALVARGGQLLDAHPVAQGLKVTARA